MIKIDFEDVNALESRSKTEFDELYKDKSHWWAFWAGVLRSQYRCLCSRVEIRHNSQLEGAKQGAKQGEDAIRLLKEIAENAVHIGGADYRIGSYEFERICKLLKSE